MLPPKGEEDRRGRGEGGKGPNSCMGFESFAEKYCSSDEEN